MIKENDNNKPLVILDRDGVINYDSDDYIKSMDEWVAIESSLTAIAKLNRAGFKVAVATNQSGIARGYFNTTTLTMIHKKMEMCLAEKGAHINDLVYCPDHPNNPSNNRKPNPGMLNQLVERFKVDPNETWFVGDSISDLECAINAKCKPALVLTGKGERTKAKMLLNQYTHLNNTPIFDNLNQFVDKIIRHKKTAN